MAVAKPDDYQTAAFPFHFDMPVGNRDIAHRCDEASGVFEIVVVPLLEFGHRHTQIRRRSTPTHNAATVAAASIATPR